MPEENEENEHQHQPAFVLPFQFGLTPEQIEQERMRGEATGHETRAFFDSLNIEQLRKLAGILRQIHVDPDASIYYQGLAAGFIDLKHGICLVCNTDHSRVPTEFTEQHKTDDVNSQQKDGQVHAYDCCEREAGKPHSYECLYMVQYNLEPDDDGSVRAMCKGCNKWYASLEDRMLRAPGVTGCEGCIEKQKWG